MKKSNTPLITAIVFATVAITGSALFLGIQMRKSSSMVPVSSDETNQEAIVKGIETYIQKQNESQIAAQKSQEQAAAEKAKNVPPIRENDHIRGDKNAVITLFEYSDFECPFCKKFHPTAQEFIDKNPNVNWVYRYFPLGFHDPLATAQAEASECAAELAGNDGFWAYADKIYAMTTSNGKGMRTEDLVTIAEEIGIKKDAFVACQKSDKYLARIKKDIEEGSAAGVRGTPGNILRNNTTGEVRFIPGAYPLSALEQAMNELLAEE